jgi:hypothetical protein
MAARARRNRGRDASGHTDPFYQRKRRYEAALGSLDLWDTFAAMPRRVQELFWERKIPDPLLDFDASTNAIAGLADVRKAADDRFQQARFETAWGEMRVRDFFGIIASCMLVVRHIDLRGFDESVVHFVNTARPVLEDFYAKHVNDASMALYMAVNVPLAAASRLDERLLSARMAMETAASGKAQARVVVCAAPPEVREITLQGIPRPMYRVAIGSPSGTPKWLTVKRKSLGIPGESGVRRNLAVYVQKHALRRLHERVNLPTMLPYLEAWLEESLSKPKVVDRKGHRGQHLFIEYRIGKNRFGYLVCTVMRKLVAVRTFKFLTMNSTPEGKRLEKRLKISRADVNYLGLHELSAFTQTDLANDSQLRWLLKKCGCGHLFELKKEDYAPQPKAFAAEMKKYLRKAA